MSWVPHNLTEHQKAEYVRICKETLKLPNDGVHGLIYKITTDDETCPSFFDVQTLQESKVRVFEDDFKSTTVKKNF